MKKSTFHPHHLSPQMFRKTTFWTLVVAVVIVTAAAALGRAAKNFKAALTDKPDIAIYLLLEDKHLGNTTLLRETEKERDYLAETQDGPQLVKMRKGEKEWYVVLMEPMHQ